MPIPSLLLLLVAGAAGVGVGIKGACNMIDANDTLNLAKKRDEENRKRYKDFEIKACNAINRLEALETDVLVSFKTFSEVIEKVKNRPTFAKINKGNVNIPKLETKDLRQESIGANIFVRGLGGAFLGGAVPGLGMLAGGIILNIMGSNMSNKADEAFSQMLENEKMINKACIYLESLRIEVDKYYVDLNKANDVYKEQFSLMQLVVEINKGADDLVDWTTLQQDEKNIIDNTTMLVGLLYHMCKVKLVKTNDQENEMNTINTAEIIDARKKCKETLEIIEAA